jgi:hypothetical protein
MEVYQNAETLSQKLGMQTGEFKTPAIIPRFCSTLAIVSEEPLLWVVRGRMCVTKILRFIP